MKVKNYLLLLVIVGLALLVAGCRYTKKEYSSVLTEDAEVVDLVYTPSRHGSGSGAGPSINMSGDVGISFVSVSVDIPEVYAIIFKCDHGKFIVQSNKHEESQKIKSLRENLKDGHHKESQKIKSLWENLKDGQKVSITYREVYKNTYDGDKLLESHLVKYNFIDAKPK